jgi:hypothetical protein
MSGKETREYPVVLKPRRLEKMQFPFKLQLPSANAHEQRNSGTHVVEFIEVNHFEIALMCSHTFADFQVEHSKCIM